MDDIIDQTLRDLFYSWRPYHIILYRLRKTCGIKRSLSWLKKQFRRMGLKRRTRDPSTVTVYQLVKEVVESSGQLYGYRTVWKAIRDKHQLIIRRSTVMKAMKKPYPDAVELRKKKTLKRRNYFSKVGNAIVMNPDALTVPVL